MQAPCGLIQVFRAGPASALTPLGTAGLRSLGLPVWLSQANSVLGATVVTMAPSPGSSQCKLGASCFEANRENRAILPPMQATSKQPASPRNSFQCPTGGSWGRGAQFLHFTGEETESQGAQCQRGFVPWPGGSLESERPGFQSSPCMTLRRLPTCSESWVPL